MTTPGRDLLDAVAEVAREECAQLSSTDVNGAAFAELDSAELQKLARTVSEPSARAESSARSVGTRAARQLPRPLARRLGLLVAAAAAVFGTGLWLIQLSSPSPEPLAQQAPTDESRRRLELPDGSTLALAEHTDARVVALDAREVRVRLLRGSVECEVAHDPERRFVVEVGALEVVVKGTRFTVSSGVRSSGASSDMEGEAPPQLVVSVERGLVEVRQPPERVLALLGAGQRWSSDGRPPPATVPLEVQALESQPEPEAPAPPAASRPRERGAAPLEERSSSASRLFEQGDAARLSGRSQRAAAAFDELRRRYPKDARAGYAAFMLGRIRLDTLDDADGAAEAFAFAIAHPAGGFFLEDAKARQVEALDRAGRRDECRAARERFLKEHPRALRADSVAQRCGTR